MTLLKLGVRTLWRRGDIGIWAFGMIGLELERGRVQSAHLGDEAWFLDTRLGNDWMLDFRSCSGIYLIKLREHLIGRWFGCFHPFIFWNRIIKATKQSLGTDCRYFRSDRNQLP
jgi:hypothetical protein